jgi:copper chaperone NosL
MKSALVLGLLLAACASGPPGPAPLDTKSESCAWCRMAVSEARFAGQIVAPYEEPRFFDDIGCLGRFVSSGKALPPHAAIYVADHRTKAWVRAEDALYTAVESLSTPMGFHLIAHADAASRDADPDAMGGSPRDAGAVLGPAGPPGGRR